MVFALSPVMKRRRHPSEEEPSPPLKMAATREGGWYANLLYQNERLGPSVRSKTPSYGGHTLFQGKPPGFRVFFLV